MFIVILQDGSKLRVSSFEGGGMLIGDPEGYEVACTVVNEHGLASSRTLKQQQIVSVTDEESGLPYLDYGSPYFPGHPEYVPND